MKICLHLYAHSIRLPFMQTFICTYVHLRIEYVHNCAKNACVVNGISHTLWGTSLPGPCRGGTALAVLCSSSAGGW